MASDTTGARRRRRHVLMAGRPDEVGSSTPQGMRACSMTEQKCSVIEHFLSMLPTSLPWRTWTRGAPQSSRPPARMHRSRKARRRHGRRRCSPRLPWRNGSPSRRRAAACRNRSQASRTSAESWFSSHASRIPGRPSSSAGRSIARTGDRSSRCSRAGTRPCHRR